MGLMDLKTILIGILDINIIAKAESIKSAIERTFEHKNTITMYKSASTILTLGSRRCMGESTA